jgi:hypothetical protein
MSAMSNPLSIQAGVPIAGSVAPTTGSAPNQPPVTPATKPVQLFVNPSYQFDPTVGLVVIEFHDNTGAVSNSIPSQRQLEAYRTGQERSPGEPAPPTPRAAVPPTPNLQAASMSQAVHGKTAAG